MSHCSNCTMDQCPGCGHEAELERLRAKYEEAMSIMSEWRNVDTATAVAENQRLRAQVASLEADLQACAEALRRIYSSSHHRDFVREVSEAALARPGVQQGWKP